MKGKVRAVNNKQRRIDTKIVKVTSRRTSCPSVVDRRHAQTTQQFCPDKWSGGFFKTQFAIGAMNNC